MYIKHLFRLVFHRLKHRAEFKIAITISFSFVLIAFAETCLHFYGCDVGELPSPANAWAWNMDHMQCNSMRAYLHFFMPVIAALVFSTSARKDFDRGTIQCIAVRQPLKSYLYSSALASFFTGFAIVFSTLLILQLLAFIAFPIEGSFQGAIGVPSYQVDTLAPGLLLNTIRTVPYVANLIFALWSSTWAGICCLISFSLSLLLQRNSSIALVIPTIVSLALYILASFLPAFLSQLIHFRFCYPNSGKPDLAVIFIIYPICIAILASFMTYLVIRKREDALL